MTGCIGKISREPSVPIFKRSVRIKNDWAKDTLLKNGLTGANIEKVVQTPYSEVDKITADDAVYYIKKTPAPLFIEAKILGMLHQIDPTFAVPKLVSVDNNNHCLLMRSCGEQTLRSLFSGQLNATLMERAVQEYKKIQNASIPHISALLKTGVPDWRLSRLPDLYDRFVRDEEALKKWSIGVDDRRKLQEQKNFFSDLCSHIASYNIPDTLNHSDFQENNMVIDSVTGNVSIIDWGEVTISHALWPVVGCFKKICWRYKIPQDSPAYHALLAHFMDGWDVREQSIEDVFSKLSILDFVYYAFSLAELKKNTEHFSAEWASRIKMALTSFLEASSAKCG